MTYEVWNHNIERGSDMEKIEEHYRRDTIISNLEVAKQRAFELAERKRSGRTRTEDGELTVRDHKRDAPAENIIEPINQGQVVYSTECLLAFPERYDPIYRTVYVVEI